MASSLLVAVVLSLAPSGAFADSSDADRAEPDSSGTDMPEPDGPARERVLDWELAGGTRFPLEIGIEAAVEVPYGLTARFGVGWMPRFYRDWVNDAAVSFGWYDETDAALVAAALEDALLLSPSIGWRPPGLGGFEIYGGYVLAFLGGTVTRAEAEEISDQDLPNVPIDEVPLSGKAHALQIGVAYQAALQRHLALRLSLAGFFIVDSSTSIDVSVQGGNAMRAVERVEAELDDTLGNILTKYVKAPLLGVSLVWRL